jgi:hypothetical protein
MAEDVKRKISIFINDREIIDSLGGVGREIGKINRKLKETSDPTERKKLNAELIKTKKRYADIKGEINDTNSALGKMKKTLGPLGPMILATFSITAILAFFKTIASEISVLRKLKGTISQITDLQGESLDRVTSKVKAMADAFESDAKKMTEAGNNLSKTMEIDFTTALELIEKGFLDGADANGDFLNKVREYPALLKEAGFSAEQSIALMTQEIKQGIYSDKGVDAIKEANLRLREMTPVAEEALNAIGLSSENIQKELTAGSKTTFEIIQEVSQRMATLPPQSKLVGQAIADIFGGPGEDAGVKYLSNLHNIDLSLTQISASANKYVEAKKLEVRANEAINNVWVKLTGTGSALSLVYSKFKLGLANLISPSNKLTDSTTKQQTALNVLVGSIIRTNENSENRKKLITELTKKYPFYLKHIKDEKTDNNSLRTALDKVNKMYVKRIALQSIESKIKDRQEIQAKKELDTAQRKIEFGKYLSIQNQKLLFGESKNLGDSLEETSKNVKEGINQQILHYSKMGSSITAQQKIYLSRYKGALQEIYEQEKSITGSNYLLGLSEDSVNEVKKNLKDIETQLGLTIKESDAFFDAGQESEFTIGGGTVGPTKVENEKAKLYKKAEEELDKLIANKTAERENLQKVGLERELALIDSKYVALQEKYIGHADKLKELEVLKDKEKENLIAAKKAEYLAAANVIEEENRIAKEALKFDREAEKAITDEEKQLILLGKAKFIADAELQIELEKELAKVEAVEGAEALKDAIRKKYALKQEITDHGFNKSKKALKKDEVEWTALSENQKIGYVRDGLNQAAQAFNRGSDAWKALKISEVAMSTYEGAQSAYTSLAKIPFVGPALGIAAAFAATTAGLARVAQIKSTKSEKMPTFFSGGFTGNNAIGYDKDGAIVGGVHKNEWVAPEIMTSNPVYAETFRFLEAERQRLQKGYFNGGPTSANTIQEGSPETTFSGSLEENNMMIGIYQSINTLNGLLAAGINAKLILPYDKIKDLKEAEDEIAQSENYGKIA